MAIMKHVFYMAVSAFDNDTGFDAPIVENIDVLIHWYYNRWLLYEGDIYVEKRPKMKHVKNNIFKVSYYGFEKNLEHAVINSEILADPDTEINFPLILNGEFCEVHGYPINLYTNQEQ